MRRGLLLLAMLAIGMLALDQLGLFTESLLPHAGGLRVLGDFLSAAWQPAFRYEATEVPADWAPFWTEVLGAVWRTVVFAVAAVSLALVVSLPLALAASMLAPTWLRIPTRILIAMMRSVHELLWAVVFLAAVGLNTGAAVLALLIPYAGTFGKIFSEMLDEAPQAAFDALSRSGATRLQAFAAGLFPVAAPDMAAYAFYRFECALRSAAVLGFFGFPTIGYYLRTSFENLHYREVWTWLYALILMVLVLEAWSSAIRRRIAG